MSARAVQCHGFLPAFLALQLSVLVSCLAVGMRTCVAYGIAGWNFQLSSWRSEQWRQILQLRQEEYRDFSGMQVVFLGFFSVPSSLCVLLITFDIDDHTSGQIDSGLDVTCVLVNLPSSREQTGSRTRLFRMRKLVDPLQLSERTLFPPMFHKSSILLVCCLPKFRNSFLFASRSQRILKEVGMASLSVQGVTWWRQFPDIHLKFSLASTASRSFPEVSETPPSSC